MKYPKRSQYKYAKSRYRIGNWPEYEAACAAGVTSLSGFQRMQSTHGGSHPAGNRAASVPMRTLPSRPL